eukprot:12442366-Alexandrium_andersonii.AAC.1
MRLKPCGAICAGLPQASPLRHPCVADLARFEWTQHCFIRSRLEMKHGFRLEPCSKRAIDTSRVQVWNCVPFAPSRDIRLQRTDRSDQAHDCAMPPA